MPELSEMKQRLAAYRATFIEPCLPTLAAKPPSGSGWIHETKHDGFRLMVHKRADGVTLITRNGRV
jgi:bifunctional non-homologous end joining protein LigD